MVADSWCAAIAGLNKQRDRYIFSIYLDQAIATTIVTPQPSRAKLVY